MSDGPVWTLAQDQDQACAERRAKGRPLNPVPVAHTSQAVVFHVVMRLSSLGKNGFSFPHREESKWKMWRFYLIKKNKSCLTEIKVAKALGITCPGERGGRVHLPLPQVQRKNPHK